MQSIVNLRNLGFVATTVIKVFFLSSMVSELEIGLENGSMWTLQTRGVTSFMSATKHWSMACEVPDILYIQHMQSISHRIPGHSLHDLSTWCCGWTLTIEVRQMFLVYVLLYPAITQESTVSNKTEPFVGLGPLGKRFKGTSDCFLLFCMLNFCVSIKLWTKKEPCVNQPQASSTDVLVIWIG